MSERRKLMLKYLTKINGKKKGKFEKMTVPRAYQQFFTPQKYSQIMINALNIPEPKKVIDLAMGEGSLLIEAKQRWTKSAYYGNDIDITCCQNLPREHNDIEYFYNDIFKNTSINKLILEIGKVDLCLGNPPFHKIKQNKDIKNILKQFGLDQVYKSDFISSEIPFILQNLKILKSGGTLSLILPDGFFTNSYLKKFRQFILDNYQVKKVIELPENIFEKTKAKTHILTLLNTKPVDSKLNLSCHEGNSVEISLSEAAERMDYNYYKNAECANSFQCLSDLDIEIFRGIPRYKLKEIDHNYILHTTNFKQTYQFKSRLRTSKKLTRFTDRIAQKNDIIIPRVGSNILGRVGIVERGYFIATDCVFVIRAKSNQDRVNIESTLKSQFGKDWVASISKGVGARHITLSDIWSMPIISKDIKNEF